MSKRGVVALVVAASTIALAGCGVDGTPQRAPLDIDPGKYKTVATDAGTGTPAWMAGAELGAHLPFLSEIDDRIKNINLGTTPLESMEGLVANMYGWEDIPKSAEFQFGFTSYGDASTPATKVEDLTPALQITALRYADENAARSAVKPLADVALAGEIKLHDGDKERGDKERGDKERGDKIVDADGFPSGSLAVESDGKAGSVSRMLMTPQGRDVLLVSSTDRSAADTTAVLKRAVDLMVNGLADAGDVGEQTSMRNADIIKLTVPFGSKDPMMQFGGAVAPTRSYAHIFNDPTRVMTMMTTAGVDLIARRETVLYRTASGEKADGLRKDFGTFLSDSTRAAPSPRDLPIARCTEAAGTIKGYACDLVVGRYYATSTSSKSLLDAQRKISAEYLILTDRG